MVPRKVSVMSAVVLMNDIEWFVRRQAGDIVAQLKAGIAMKATVVRNGKETDVEARELVPGDIVSTACSVAS